MSLGRLVATLGIDSADWVQGLTKAEHQMKQFERSVSKGMEDVAKKVGLMALAMVSVGKAMEVFDKTVQYTAALDDLADTAGMTVEKMDALVLSYNLIGISTEAAGKGILAFEKSLVQASDQGSKQAKVFEALGVKLEYLKDGSVNVEKAMTDTVRSMAAIQDPALRAEIATTQFGKAGKEMALKMGDLAAAQKLAAEQMAIYGPITDEAAKAGERFEQQNALLGDALVRVTAPAMVDVTKGLGQFRDAFNAVGPGLSDFISMVADALVGAFKAVLSVLSLVIATFKTIGAAIYMVMESMDALVSGRGLGGVKDAWNAFQTRLDDTSYGLGEFNARLWSSNAAVAETGKSAAKTDAELKKLRGSVTDVGKASEAAAKEAAKQTEQWRLAADALEMGVSPATLKSLESLTNEYKKGQMPLETYLKLWQYIYENDSKIQASAKEKAKLQADEYKRYDDLEKAASERYIAQQKELEGIQKGNDKLRDEIAVMGMSSLARELYNSGIERTNALRGIEDITQRNAINAKFDERDALLAARDAGEQYQRGLEAQADMMMVIEDYGRSMFQALGDGMKGLSNWAKQVGQDLKRYLLDVLYQATLKPFLISIVSSASGVAAPAASAVSTGADLLSSASTAASLTSALSGISSAASAAYAGTSLAGGATAAVVEGGIVVAGGTAGAGGLGAAAAAGLAAVPVAGWVALGALAAFSVYKMLKKKKAPHIRGYAETAGFSGAGMGGKLDAAVQPFIDETAGTYESLNLALGGSAENQLGFGVALDTQKGKAAKIATSAMLNGQSIYSGQVRGGKTEEEVNAALQLEASRVILAALQASNLPADIAKILDAIPAGETSQETIDRLLGIAAAVAQINDAIASLDDIDTILEELADDSMTTAFERQGEALREMLSTFDGSVAATENLVAASGVYYESLLQLQSQIYAITQAVDQMFAETSESILTAGRDASWMVNHLNEDAEAAFATLIEATDPAKIQEMAQRINADILEAFNLLTPEEQSAQRDYYLESVQRVDAAVGDRLKAIGAESSAAFKENMGEVKVSLTEVATQMKSAADVQRDAADTQLEAANTPIQIVVSPSFAEVNG